MMKHYLSNPLPSTRRLLLQWLSGLWLLTGGTAGVRAADFSVSTPNNQFSYVINGVSGNPTLTLTRGQVYTFAVSAASDHPLEILGAGTAVANNNIFSGTLTFTVPATGPTSYNYICSLHGFGGIINVVAPAPPPAPVVKILSVTLTTTNITLLSTGTNGWAPVPMFSSNILRSNFWAVVPGYSNFYNGGTNRTTFPRLEAICGPKVFLRVNNTN